MSNLRALLNTISCTETDVELVLNSKNSSGSFSDSDKLDKTAAVNFVQLLHSIAEARKEGQDSDDIFLSRCASVVTCLRIMLDNNSVLDAYFNLFNSKFVGGLNALLGELVAIDLEQEREMADVLIQFVDVLVELTPLHRGAEVVSLFFFTRIFEFLSLQFTRNTFHLLPVDLLCAIFESILGFLPHWTTLPPELTEKLLFKIRPRSDKFLPILFESLFDIGDLSFQSAIVLSTACVGKKGYYRKLLIKTLAKAVTGNVVEKLVKAYSKVFDAVSFAKKMTAAANFLHAANQAIGQKSVSSIPLNDLTVNGDKVNAPASEIDDSMFWCDFNVLTSRLSILLCNDETTVFEFLFVPPTAVKKVDFFSETGSPRVSSITLTVSQLPELKCLPKVQPLRGGVYELKISCNTSTEFIAKLKTIYSQEIFVDRTISQRPTSYPQSGKAFDGMASSGWDNASVASVYRVAFVDGTGKQKQKISPPAPKKPEPEVPVAPKTASKPAQKTYGRKSAHPDVGGGDAGGLSPASNPSPAPPPESTNSKRKKNSTQKSSISAATRKSLENVFSEKAPAENDRHEGKFSSDHELPEITSSVYSASDYTRKLPTTATRKSVAFHLPSPVVEVTVQTEEQAEAFQPESVASAKRSGKKVAVAEDTLGNLDETPLGKVADAPGSARLSLNTKKSRVASEKSKEKPVSETPALPKQAAQRKQHRKGKSEPDKLNEVEPKNQLPAVIDTSAPLSAAVRKQPLRKAVVDAENRKKMEKEQLKELNSIMASAAKKVPVSSSKRSETIPLFDENEFSDEEPPQSPPKRSRKTPTKKAATTARKPRQPKNRLSLEEQVEAAFTRLPNEDDLPSLIVEEGFVDDTGRLVGRKITPPTVERGNKENVSSAQRKPPVSTVVDRLAVDISPPVASAERMRHSGFKDFHPITDELNGIIDRISENAATTISPPQPTGSHSQKKASVTTPLGNNEVEPLLKKTPQNEEVAAESSPTIISRSAFANRKATAAGSATNSAPQPKTGSVQRQSAQNTPKSWSESFPESSTKVNGTATPLGPTQPKPVSADPYDVNIVSLAEQMVGDALDRVTELSTKGSSLVGKIADANATVRTCSDKLRNVEYALNEYSMDMKQLEAIKKNLELIRQILSDRRRSSADRRRIEEKVSRIHAATASGQMAKDPAQFRKMLDALLKSVGVN